MRVPAGGVCHGEVPFLGQPGSLDALQEVRLYGARPLSEYLSPEILSALSRRP